MLSKEFNYNLIFLDDIICTFEQLSECNIRHDDNMTTTKEFSPFLIRYLK